jgi:gas vesicle protein
MRKKEIEELKSLIYSKIDKLNNEAALHLLEEAVTAYTSPQKDVLDDLTEKQKERLKKSVEQAKEGKTISNEEVKIKARKWLSK